MAVSSNKKIKSVVRFNPNPAPVATEQLPDYLFNELNRLGEIIKDKPRAGDIRYADGSDWNPGGTGEGIYFYNSSAAWVKLG